MNDIYQERKKLNQMVTNYPAASLLEIVQAKAKIDMLQKTLLGSHDTEREVKMFFGSFVPTQCQDIALSGYNWFLFRESLNCH